jgi:hypothetical protein
MVATSWGGALVSTEAPSTLVSMFASLRLASRMALSPMAQAESIVMSVHRWIESRARTNMSSIVALLAVAVSGCRKLDLGRSSSDTSDHEHARNNSHPRALGFRHRAVDF